jgi:hypothetical protein
MIITRAVCLIALSSCLVQLPGFASAAVCANGVYAAGCAGPNGAVAVRKPAYPPPTYYHPPAPAYRPPGSVTCASGPYRAGCAGPNGAAVVHKTY